MMETKTPKIRFKDFSGDKFRRMSLNDFSEINPRVKNLPESFVYVDLESVKDGRLTKEDVLQKEMAPSRAQRLLEKGDILFPMVRPYQQNNLYFDRDGKYVASTGYAQIRAKEDGQFMFHFLHTKKFVSKVLKVCTGTSYPAVSSSDLGDIEISAPSLPEQQKIASFLSSVDERIELLERKKEKLEAYKKGVMQQIFSQQIRFKQDDGSAFPDWEEKRLGELTFKTGKKNREGKVLPTYSINNIVGFLPQSEQFDGIDSYERGFDTKSYKIVEKNMFAYNPARINVGSIGFSGDLENILISSLYVCFKTVNDLEPQFLLQFMKTYTFTKAVLRNTEGGVRDYLFYENFSKIKIMLPSREEQKKIAAFLNSIDENLETLDSQIRGLRTWKKGLLQQMFV